MVIFVPSSGSLSLMCCYSCSFHLVPFHHIQWVLLAFAFEEFLEKPFFLLPSETLCHSWLRVGQPIYCSKVLGTCFINSFVIWPEGIWNWSRLGHECGLRCRCGCKLVYRRYICVTLVEVYVPRSRTHIPLLIVDHIAGYTIKLMLRICQVFGWCSCGALIHFTDIYRRILSLKCTRSVHG